jgi:hypothetical protein
MSYTTMGHKAAQEYVDHLWSHGKKKYDSLNGEELNKLTGLFMQECDSSGKGEFVYNTPVVRVMLQKLVDALTKPSFMNDLTLLSSLKSGATLHAKNIIDELFEERQEQHEAQLLRNLAGARSIAEMVYGSSPLRPVAIGFREESCL